MAGITIQGRRIRGDEDVAGRISKLLRQPGNVILPIYRVRKQRRQTDLRVVRPIKEQRTVFLRNFAKH